MSQGRVAMISALCELSRELFPRVGVSVIFLSELITCKERWSLWPFAAATRAPPKKYIPVRRKLFCTQTKWREVFEKFETQDFYRYSQI